MDAVKPAWVSFFVTMPAIIVVIHQWVDWLLSCPGTKSTRANVRIHVPRQCDRIIMAKIDFHISYPIYDAVLRAVRRCG